MQAALFPLPLQGCILILSLIQGKPQPEGMIGQDAGSVGGRTLVPLSAFYGVGAAKWGVVPGRGSTRGEVFVF